MSSLVKSYKFFSTDPKEIDRQTGNYPIEYLVPFGPEHVDEFDAQEWLKENAEFQKKYILFPVYQYQS